MKLKKKILIKGFADSYKAIRKNPSYVAIPFFIDLLFLFVFFIAYNFFLGNIMNKVISLLMLTGKALQGLTQTDISLNVLSDQQQMNSLIVNIGFWIFGLAVLIYFIYCLSQGVNWFIAHKMFKIKWDNPFKMWGAWVGGIIGFIIVYLLFPRCLPCICNVQPCLPCAPCPPIPLFVYLILLGIIVLGFLIGWGIHSLIKTKPADYIKRFFAVNLVWYAMVVIISYFYVKAVIYTRVLRTQSNLGIVNMFSAILLIVICYFAFVSYVLIKKHCFIDSIKKSFSLAIKEFLTIACMYILFILGFALIDIMLKLIFMININLMIIVGIILIFPVIAYMRLVIISVVEDLDKTK